MENRKQFNDLIIGGNGSGKTTLQIEIAIHYLQNNPRKRGLFILSDDGEEKLSGIREINLKTELETFTGVKKVIIDSASDFEYIAETYRSKMLPNGERVYKNFNGLMCCDDLGGAMNRRPQEIINFLKKRRQPNIDFLWSFHGLRCDVPPAFYTYVNRIYLLPTSDNHEETMKHLPMNKRKEFEDAYFEVQEESKYNPHFCKEIVINPIKI